ncbi:hypothetical protein P262_00113 [Cronobacter malonaticus]|uniref:Uncharacterized protein n=4 Tax=Cronobacter TaxID=413496 RepID=A7MQ37_CROS8|nr:hypothetical protein ESA_03907 [Cronobacter sakazakii ATCC BAA-894]AHB68439.1 hypothetical protein P262_00113 [Cronobacter malonaticus]CBA26808.1 unknown protein [Cronobacter turicensis z3032]CCJ90723.1 hypothetical protein BN132_2651 [Cronobacter turicensis 564]CCK04661.1 hypothetical protein BN129_3434 [Cronobacter sakazakii 701]CCK09309.1 hypothetical protein BN128_3430 [Cronobacter sakazakii 696]
MKFHVACNMKLTKTAKCFWQSVCCAARSLKGMRHLLLCCDLRA